MKTVIKASRKELKKVEEELRAVRHAAEQKVTSALLASPLPFSFIRQSLHPVPLCLRPFLPLQQIEASACSFLSVAAPHHTLPRVASSLRRPSFCHHRRRRLAVRLLQQPPSSLKPFNLPSASMSSLRTSPRIRLPGASSTLFHGPTAPSPTPQHFRVRRAQLCCRSSRQITSAHPQLPRTNNGGCSAPLGAPLRTMADSRKGEMSWEGSGGERNDREEKRRGGVDLEDCASTDEGRGRAEGGGERDTHAGA